MTSFAGYWIGFAQIDDEINETSKFRPHQNSTINLLICSVDMPDMSCFANGAIKQQHFAILQSFGMTEGIIFPFTRLPSTTQSFLLSYFISLLIQKLLKPPLLFDLPTSLNFSNSKFGWAAKSSLSDLFEVKHDLTAKNSSSKIIQVNLWLTGETSIILEYRHS